jgi:hypothetical protein
MDRAAGTALVYGVLGIALLVVLWPTMPAGRRFLQRWGAPDPDERQGAQAAKYLRDRRLLYPLLFLLAPAATAPAARTLGVPYLDSGPVRYLAPLIVALLLAETVAALRPVRGPRIATLARRRWRDLVPRWAIGTLLTLGVVAVLLAVAGLFAQPWANRIMASIPPDGVWRSADGATLNVSEQYRAEIDRPVCWIAITGVALGLVVVLGVVRLAVRRGSVADPQVDAALRTRSARVAVGIGIAWMASMVLVANNRLGFLRGIRMPVPGFPPAPGWLEHTSATDFLGLLVLFIAAAGWIWVANPPRRMPYVQTAA